MNIRAVTIFIKDDLSRTDSKLEVKWRCGEGIRTAEIAIEFNENGELTLMPQHVPYVGGPVVFPSQLETWEVLDRKRKA